MAADEKKPPGVQADGLQSSSCLSNDAQGFESCAIRMIHKFEARAVRLRLGLFTLQGCREEMTEHI